MADSHTIKLSNATSYCLTSCSLIQRLVSWLPNCTCHRMASALEQWPLGKPSGTVRKPAIRARMVGLKPNRSCALLLLQLPFRVTAVSYMPGLPNRSSPQLCVRDTQHAQVISHLLSSVSVQPWYSTLNQSVSRPFASHFTILYRKYSPLAPLPGGTALRLSGTAEKMVNFGSRSSRSDMMEATLPQR